MSSTVHVENIAPATSEKELRDFFSFCGAIRKLEITGDATSSKKATVTFEKEQAARTALMLDNTHLGTASVKVSAGPASDDGGSAAATTGSGDDTGLAQEDKPAVRIFAEYLAHGYVLTDNVIEKGIAMDKQHGFSARFTDALKSFDSTVHASDSARAVNEKLDVTGKSQSVFSSLYSYFDRAMDNSVGQKLRALYTAGNKQVVDVHNEAKHLASIIRSDKTTCNCQADAGKCSCEPGKCACSGCSKNTDAKCSCNKCGKDCKCENGVCKCSCCPDNTGAKCSCTKCGKDCKCENGVCKCSCCPDKATTAGVV